MLTSVRVSDEGSKRIKFGIYCELTRNEHSNKRRGDNLSDRYVPERTVDSLLAIELIRSDPNTLLWSPTNYASSPDHVVYGRGLRGFVFESKAVTRSSDEAPWRAPLDIEQLSAYLRLAARVRYVFLTPPHDGNHPWQTNCEECRDFCEACPRDARRLAGLESSVAGAPPLLRLQPWFAHWAVVATDQNVERYRVSRSSIELGTALPLQAGFSRLCHFLHGVRVGTIPAAPLSSYQLDNIPVRTSTQPDSATLIAALPRREAAG